MFPRLAVQRAVVHASRRAFGAHAPAVEKPVLGMEKPSFSIAKRTTPSLPGDYVRSPPVQAWSFNRIPNNVTSNGWKANVGEVDNVINEQITPPNPVGANFALGIFFGTLIARTCYVGGEYAVRCGFARATPERQEQIKQWYEARLLQGPLFASTATLSI